MNAIQEQEEEQNILIDGAWWTPEGEFVSFADKPKFEVTDLSSAEWVLEKLMERDLEIAKIQQRRRVLVENLDAMEKAEQRKKDGLLYRFLPGLEAFAKSQLKGQKTRTFKTPFGSLSFRTVKGGLRVADAEKALEWARQFAPEAIKTSEAFQISLLEDTKKATICYAHDNSLAGTAGRDSGAFEVKPDHETFSVKTGVEASK